MLRANHRGKKKNCNLFSISKFTVNHSILFFVDNTMYYFVKQSALKEGTNSCCLNNWYGGLKWRVIAISLLKTMVYWRPINSFWGKLRKRVHCNNLRVKLYWFGRQILMASNQSDEEALKRTPACRKRVQLKAPFYERLQPYLFS